ncbi:MAG: hypothetical protein IPG08_08695 [Sphingobacteriaceae bacterium]|nr:hypothetical protein [Sphingobacteriaceae bacterium]
MRSPTAYILLFISILCFSCRKDKALANYGNYPNQVGKIISLKCATSGCHNDKSYKAASSLNLTTWADLFKGTNSGSAVIPFRSDFSSLCYFINTYPELGLTNSPTMPLNKPVLTKEEVTTIRDWIDAGAPDINGEIKWADNLNRKKAYVVNQGCDVVTVLDSETQLPIRYVTVGNKKNIVEVPHMIKVSPDGKYWYVVFIANSLIQKFKCSYDSFVGETTLGPSNDWNTVVISDNGTRGYCVSWTSNGRIASVDLEQMKLIYSIPGFNYPHGIALNATNDTMYVTAQTGNFIFKVDTAFSSPEQISIEPGFLPSSISKLDAHEIFLSPDKQSFYISCQKTNDLRVFNIATRQITNIIPTGYYPQEIAICYTLNKIYVSSPYDSVSVAGQKGTITEIDIATLIAKSPLSVGYMPHGIGVDETKKLLYVASRNLFIDGPTPHHSSVCSGRNGFLNFIDLINFSVLPRRTELSVDPYSVSVRN